MAASAVGTQRMRSLPGMSKPAPTTTMSSRSDTGDAASSVVIRRTVDSASSPSTVSTPADSRSMRMLSSPSFPTVTAAGQGAVVSAASPSSDRSESPASVARDRCSPRSSNPGGTAPEALASRISTSSAATRTAETSGSGPPPSPAANARSAAPNRRRAERSASWRRAVSVAAVPGGGRCGGRPGRRRRACERRRRMSSRTRAPASRAPPLKRAIRSCSSTSIGLGFTCRSGAVVGGELGCSGAVVVVDVVSTVVAGGAVVGATVPAAGVVDAGAGSGDGASGGACSTGGANGGWAATSGAGSSSTQPV